METAWNPAKRDLNKSQHKLDFADFAGFDAPPIVVLDDRKNYGEDRFRAFGRIDGKGYCVVYTKRGMTMWMISFRRARDKELRRYGQ